MTRQPDSGAAREARMRFNVVGFLTLTRKEVRRFMKVVGQTVLSPVITAVLYLVVFGHVLEDRITVYGQLSYTAFLVPGLIMMSVIQNAFANSSSSLIQSKIMGNLVFMLMAPLSSLEIFAAFLCAAVLRAVMVAAALYAIAWLFVPVPIIDPASTLLMLLLVSGNLAVLGIIAGILADKFEHLAAFQNFFIMPMSFLSGVFYSIHSLPEFWRELSAWNPFFYMIDGFRYGFFGVADTGVLQSLAVVGAFFIASSGLCLWMLASGYRLRG